MGDIRHKIQESRIKNQDLGFEKSDGAGKDTTFTEFASFFPKINPQIKRAFYN